MKEGDFCYGKIGQIICTYRKINCISQEELAGIVGVSAGSVSKWENVDDVNGDRGKCLTLLILWKISDN